jgi:hypothetical protein
MRIDDMAGDMVRTLLLVGARQRRQRAPVQAAGSTRTTTRSMLTDEKPHSGSRPLARLPRVNAQTMVWSTPPRTEARACMSIHPEGSSKSQVVPSALESWSSIPPCHGVEIVVEEKVPHKQRRHFCCRR